MILEEETKKRFGYYSTDLSFKSSKKIVVVCKKCGKIREVRKDGCAPLCRSCAKKGFRFSEETKQKMSDSHKGEKAYWYGKKLSEEHKRKLSKSHKGNKPTEETRKKLSKIGKGRICSEETRRKISEAQKGREFTKEHREKLRESRKHSKHGKTAPEIRFEEICKKYNLPFKYVGDYSLWIGSKKGKKLNPDFIETNGKKQIVEIMGRYWHSPLLNPRVKESANLYYRQKHYRRYGWKSIFIWDTDLERKDAEAFVLSLLKDIK